jgi:hypothetical protein
LQAADEQKIDQKVEIVRHCFAIDAQGAGKGGGVEQAALIVGKHGPEPA